MGDNNARLKRININLNKAANMLSSIPSKGLEYRDSVDIQDCLNKINHLRNSLSGETEQSVGNELLKVEQFSLSIKTTAKDIKLNIEYKKTHSTLYKMVDDIVWVRRHLTGKHSGWLNSIENRYGESKKKVEQLSDIRRKIRSTYGNLHRLTGERYDMYEKSSLLSLNKYLDTEYDYNLILLVLSVMTLELRGKKNRLVPSEIVDSKYHILPDCKVEIDCIADDIDCLMTVCGYEIIKRLRYTATEDCAIDGATLRKNILKSLETYNFSERSIRKLKLMQLDKFEDMKLFQALCMQIIKEWLMGITL